jgi:hypothetical protein
VARWASGLRLTRSPSSVASSLSAAAAAPTPVVFGPTLEWVPRTRDYATDPTYAAFRQRALQALALLPDYPVDVAVNLRGGR